jgi:subtilase family serine protease
LVDASIAGVVRNVVGLDNLAVPRPLVQRAARGVGANVSKHVVTGGPQPCAAATSTASAAHTYTADQIASAYGFSGLYGAGDFGSGQTVAIYELEGNFPSDITAYESCYGITAPVSYKAVDGGPPAPSTLFDDGLESELDIENVVGLAPQANVIVYQAPNSNSGLPGAGPYDLYNQIVSDNLARVVSTSWGICEAQNTPSPTVAQDENTLFQEAAAQGQSVFAASGDNGSTDCTDLLGNPVPVLAADDPGTQPFVTSSGGTRLSAIGPPPGEVTWNGGCSGGPCGGGGGISRIWPMPSYQAGAPASLKVINSHSSGAPCSAPAGSFCREVPDVSADAQPSTGYTIYYDGSFDNGTPLGGTSAVAPLLSALIALANDSSACHGSPIGFANPALYRAAAASASNFNDITLGNNDILGATGGLFPAGSGYDMATGLGSPNAAALAGSLCAATVRVSNPGAQRSAVGHSVSTPVTASDAPGKTITYSASGLPPGLSISSSTGTVSGTPTSPGAFTVTVHAVDSDGSAGNATFAWTVEGQPRALHASLKGVHKGKPKLSFTLTIGSFGSPLRKIVVILPKGLSFSRKARDLKRGIKPRGASFKVRGGKLTITLKNGVTKTVVTISPPALSESQALRQAHKKLKFTLQAIDSSGFATTIKLKLRPS